MPRGGPGENRRRPALLPAFPWRRHWVCSLGPYLGDRRGDGLLEIDVTLRDAVTPAWPVVDKGVVTLPDGPRRRA